MTVDHAWERIAERISDRQVLGLEQAAIRIPSTTFEEGPLADHLANYMSDVGLDVEMMEVTHSAKPGKRTRQTINPNNRISGMVLTAPGRRVSTMRAGRMSDQTRMNDSWIGNGRCILPSS